MEPIIDQEDKNKEVDKRIHQIDVELINREVRTLKVWQNLYQHVIKGGFHLFGFIPLVINRIRKVFKRAPIASDAVLDDKAEAAWSAFGRSIFFPVGSSGGTLFAFAIPILLTWGTLAVDRYIAEKQAVIDDAARRSGSEEVVAILDSYSNLRMQNSALDSLPLPLLDRIVASTVTMQPYLILDDEKHFKDFTDKAYSPERGKILTYLMQSRPLNLSDVLQGANFEHSYSKGIRITDIPRISGGNFSHSDLGKAEFRRASFAFSHFDSVAFRAGNLAECLFFKCNLRHADFRDVTIGTEVSFEYSDLSYADFSGAKLSLSRNDSIPVFNGATLHGAKMSAALKMTLNLKEDRFD